MLVEHADQEADLSALVSPGHVSPPWPLDEFLARTGVVLARSDDRRRYARLYYRRRAVLTLATSLPAFPRTAQRVRTYSCDLSRSGIAFLSACELYPKEAVTLQVEGLGSRQATVVRCRRLAKGCFEIGARFAADAALPPPTA